MEKEPKSPEIKETQEAKPSAEATSSVGKSHDPSIATALDRFLHKCEDIKSAVQLVEAADKIRSETFQALAAEIKEASTLLAAKDNKSVFGLKKLWKALTKFNHLIKSKESTVIENSLFLGLFSAFDAFMGKLVTTIYCKRPELYASLTRTITIPEILHHKSFEHLKNSILRDEIESLRRKSYADQFKELENTFGVKLRLFEAWPKFVECSQRRNLITHCDGEVNEQYLEACDREGHLFESRPEIGKRLTLGSNYFLSACDLVAEVAVKLAHTLWRKLFPDELEEADKELGIIGYDCLVAENYRLAQVYGLFAKNQKNISSDINRRIFIINYAIALKFDSKSEEANAVLKEGDWTACLLDFKLAEAVLSDKIDDACVLMKKIGKTGEIIKEESYHIWPLFRWFRVQPKFLTTYEEIYGHSFIEELQRTVVDKAQSTIEENISSIAEPIKSDAPEPKITS